MISWAEFQEGHQKGTPRRDEALSKQRLPNHYPSVGVTETAKRFLKNIGPTKLN